MKIKQLNEDVVSTWKTPLVLEEELLVEGPLSWLKNKIDPKGAEERAKKQQKKEHDKIMNKKIPVALALDYDQKSAKSKFYINHNYSKPLTQAAYQQWIKTEEGKLEKMPEDPPESGENGKKAQAKKKFEAARINTIVVDQNGQYIRRGGESLVGGHVAFIPGNNDKITNGYFAEPYKYSGAKSSAPKPTSGATGKSAPKKTSTKITPTILKKFQKLCLAFGAELTDLQGKRILVNNIKKPEDLANCKVKVGSASIEAIQWIHAQRENGVI